MRAYSFSILCSKDDFNIDNTLLSNLDDTSTITYCRGEWGENFILVSDYYIYKSKGHTTIPEEVFKNKIIENHRYLKNAYTFISNLDTPELKYYRIIKEMAYKENPADKKVNSLYALSKYKRSEDIPFIAEEISHYWRSQNSHPLFEIIEENPDTTYFKILEKFYKSISYGKTREERQLNFYLSTAKLHVKYESFLKALVAYKSIRSSRIIADILDKEIYPLESIAGINYRYTIYQLLFDKKCKEYSDLITLLKPEATEIEKKIIRAGSNLDSMAIDIPSNGYW